jgi:tetratricopeptide (TPR) repeat protein
MQKAQYKAFISYSHGDDKWAAWLHRALESYKPPKKLVGQQADFGPIPPRLTPIFRDREELPTATDLGTVINNALLNSECQIVVCSPQAAQSKWVNEEILAFKRLERADRIFCLIVDGEPNASDIPGREDEECFPQALRYRLGEDGELSNERAEPIAADARENKDGKANAKVKLIAGMLGVGFDALAQRELHRRQRRMMAIAAASIIGMVVTSGLAVTAMLARADAEAQRAVAETQRAEAERQAETARQTTNFMVELFEVSDPSEALGNSITAKEILERGARRIEFELADQPAIQSTLMDTMGTVYGSLGLYDEAGNLIQRGLETRRELYGQAHAEVARSQANLAHIRGQQADFEAAVELYESAIAWLREDEEANSRDLALSLFGLADVRSLQGEYDAAEQLLREAIEIQREGGQAESLELARSIDQLGLTLSVLARYDEAEPLLREALAMRRRLIPGGIHPDLDDSLNNLAFFLYEAGEYEETESLFRESLEINLQLLGEEHPDIAISMNNLAIVLEDAGEYESAEQYFQRALDLRLEFLGEAHPLTAQSLNNLAFLYGDQGDLDRALEFSRRALTTYQNAYPGDHPDVAWGMQNLAGWLVEVGDYATAEPLLDEALGMMARVLPDDHPDVGITQSGMAVLLLDTNRADDALAMATAASELLSASLGDDHWRTAWAESLEGAALAALGRLGEAEPLLRSGYEVLSTARGPRRSQVNAVLDYLISLYTSWDRPEDAARFRALGNRDD